MKVHQELRIGPLTADQEAEFISWISERLSEGWSRDLAREKELNDEAGTKFYCFGCSEEAKRAAATLLLTHPARRARTWLYVSNILPKNLRHLSYDQYNFILQNFSYKFAKPAADLLNIPIELSSPEQSVENWLGSESAKRLRAFSVAANKSTGSSHPMDRERWCDFLIALHREGEDPGAELLERWFVEEEKWPEEVASDLICEFEFAHDLLSRFDKR